MARKASQRKLTVCLLSGHALVLGELQAVLEGAGMRVVPRRLESGLTAELPPLPRARVYVVDVHGSAPAMERVVAAVLRRQPKAHLLVLAEKFTDRNAFPLLRMGTKGLLGYAEAREQLPRAAQAVSSGSFWVPRPLLARFVDSILATGPGAARKAAQMAGAGELSRREREVMDALLQNLANKEIAGKLNIAERTVKFHVSSILAKFGVQRRADLILRFYQERAQNS